MSWLADATNIPHAQSFVYAEQTIDATIAFNKHLVKRRMARELTSPQSLR